MNWKMGFHEKQPWEHFFKNSRFSCHFWPLFDFVFQGKTKWKTKWKTAEKCYCELPYYIHLKKLKDLFSVVLDFFRSEATHLVSFFTFSLLTFCETRKKLKNLEKWKSKMLTCWWRHAHANCLVFWIQKTVDWVFQLPLAWQPNLEQVV